MLPDPWFPVFPYLEAGAIEAPTTLNAAAWPIANTAIYLPVYFPSDETVYSLAFAAATGTGNYDLAFHNADLTRIASSGSVAMVAAGTKTLALGNVDVQAGLLYYACLSLSNVGGQVWRCPFANVRDMNAVGMGIEAAAFPIPPTLTPVAVSAAFGGVCPLLAFGVRP